MSKRQRQSFSGASEENWNSFLYTIYYDPVIGNEMTAPKQNQLSEWISSGYRQRFTVCSKQDVIAWAQENIKTNEACKEFKVAIDSGATIDTVSDLIMAKLVKAWLFFHKQETIEARNGLKQAAIDQENEKKKAENSKAAPPPAAAPPAKKPNPKDPKAKPTEAVPPPATSSNDNGSKRKDKLRDRAGGKERIQAVGDEPVTGPDMYYLLKDLDSPGIISSLAEDLDLPIHAVFRVEDLPSLKKAESATPAPLVPNNSWSVLKSRSKNHSSWRSTVWVNVQASDFREHKDAFEILANRIYGIIERKKDYELFYKGDRIISIPNFDKIDLRFYDYLLNLVDATTSGLKIETIVALAMEYMRRIQHSEDQNIPDLTNAGLNNLKIFFEKELDRLVLDVDKSEYDEKVLKNTVVLEYEDKATVLGLCMNVLQSLDLDATEMIRKIINSSSAQKYLTFLESFEEYRTLSRDQIIGESMRFQTEFFKNIQNSLDAARLELLLTQTEFEAFCSQHLADGQKINLDNWRWYSSLSSTALIQAIDNSKMKKPEVFKYLSSFHGKLLLLLKSPGPIGCLEFSTTSQTKVRTKVGLSTFYDLFDPHSNTVAGDKGNSSDEKTGAAYDFGDKLMTINEKVKYMYPYNMIVKLVSTNSSITDTDTHTKVYFADHCLSYAGSHQSSKGPYFTTSFADGFVYSMNRNEKGVTASFSVGKTLVSLQEDGNIIVQGFPVENTASSKLRPAEVKRMYIPNGVLVTYFENKSVQVLYPDGSSAMMNPQKSWTVLNKDGEGDGITRMVAQERLPDETVTIVREDCTTIEQSRHKIVASHSDGTTISTFNKNHHTIVTQDGFKVTFEPNGFQTIECCKNTAVMRHIEGGKDYCDIDISSDAEIKVQFANSGYAHVIQEGLNTATINWTEGTTDIKDILGYQFKINSHGHTSVQPPQEKPIAPTISFGGKLIKGALKEHQENLLIGNVPDFYIISPNEQDGCQIKSDLEVLQYYQNNKQNFYRATEIAGSSKSVTYSVVSQLQPPGLDSTIIQYNQMTCYPVVPLDVKETVRQQYRDFMAHTEERGEGGPLDELGETHGGFKPQQDPNSFCFGADKEATRLAIIMNYMEQEKLESNPGINSNDDIERLLKQAKTVKVKAPSTPIPRPNPESIVARKIAKHVRGETSQKNMKYFDSPEGNGFLQTLPPPVQPSPGNQSVEVPEISPNVQSSTESEEKATEEEIAPPSKQLNLTTPPNHKRVIPTIIEPEKPNTRMKQPEMKPKERKLNLPAAILGAKPGVEPNVTHLTQEGDTKRKIRTVSTTMAHKTVPTFGEGGFVVLPSLAKFGSVESGVESNFAVTITNVGLDSVRYTIRQPKKDGIKVRFKHGPVAPGMSAKLIVNLNMTNDQESSLEVKEEFQIVSETEILHVPIKATILPK